MFLFFNRFLQFLKNVSKCSKLKFQKFGTFLSLYFILVFGKEILMNENLQLFKGNKVSPKAANQIGKKLAE